MAEIITYIALGNLLASLVYFYFYIKNKKATQLLINTIELQKLELEQSNNLKSKIFSMIGHDLRSPISGLSSMLTLKQSGTLTQERIAELDERILKSLQSTSTSLDNLLIWSRAQINHKEAPNETFNLAEIISTQIELLRPQATAKHIKLVSNFEPNIMVTNDKNGASVIVRNLLNNAIKFSPASSSIIINATMQNDKCQVEIKDQGIGMSPTLIQNFMTGIISSTPGTENEKGTGIGTLLIKDFCEQMHANLQIESELGKGSSFKVWL
jgi:signal transduction histidine kinase